MRGRLGPLVALVAIAACATPARTPPPDVALHVPAIAAATPTAAAPPKRELLPDVPDATDWEDEHVIDRLAVDCRWRPSNLDRPLEYSKHPLSCVLDQRPLNDNPCFIEYEEQCKPACTKTCNGCAGGCVQACETCHSACTGDDCKRACAKTTATCRQECVGAAVECQVARCNVDYMSCSQTLQNEMKKPGCRAACPQAYRCGRACETSGTHTCIEGCRHVFGLKCADRFFEYCVSGGS